MSRRKKGSPPNCPDCHESDISKFYVDKKGQTTNARCKVCQREHNKKHWHSYTKEQKQATRVKSMYGITPEKYFKLVENQNGKCAICGKEPSTVRGLHLDHCHDTKKVRELLCHHCNIALGSFNEDIEIMKKAIAYIKKHKNILLNKE